MTVCRYEPREGTKDDGVHIYELNVRLLVMQCEEKNPEPLEHVASAVKSLLEDNAFEWLLEAIGHPNAEAFEASVTGKTVDSVGPGEEEIRSA